MTEVEFYGNSMRPLIQSGAALLCSTERLPRVGDIVLFQADELLVAHRLVGWRGTGAERQMLLRGDNRRRLDPPLDLGRCLGVVEAIFSNGKRLDCRRPVVRVGFWLVAKAGRVAAPDGPRGQAPTGKTRLASRFHRLVCYLVHTCLLVTSWRTSHWRRGNVQGRGPEST